MSSLAEATAHSAFLRSSRNLLLHLFVEERIAQHHQVRVEDRRVVAGKAGGQALRDLDEARFRGFDGVLHALELFDDLVAVNVAAGVTASNVAEDERGSDGDARRIRRCL